MTSQEQKLWLHLREFRKQGFHFRRQVPINGFIVDFACYHPKLVIEIDGSQHSGQRDKRRDTDRDTYLTANGFRVLRFWNSDVDQNLQGVLTLVLLALRASHPGAA